MSLGAHIEPTVAQTVEHHGLEEGLGARLVCEFLFSPVIRCSVQVHLLQALCYIEMKVDFSQLPLLELRTSYLQVCKSCQLCDPIDKSNIGTSFTQWPYMEFKWGEKLPELEQSSYLAFSNSVCIWHNYPAYSGLSELQILLTKLLCPFHFCVPQEPDSWICLSKLHHPFFINFSDPPVTEDGWVIYKDYQYYFSKEKETMDNAREFCKRNFGDLVSIQSESKKKFLWKYVRIWSIEEWNSDMIKKKNYNVYYWYPMV